MSREVWRYPLPPLGGRTAFKMPAGAQPVNVMLLTGGPALMVVVNPAHKPVTRTFHMVSTGSPVDDLGPYVGSFPDPNGMMVWHVFEVPNG